MDRIDKSGTPSSDQVNDLARVLNLATVGTPPEVETGYQVDDLNAYDNWCSSAPVLPAGWDNLPFGPRAVDTTDRSLQGAANVVSRAWGYAGLED